MVFEVKGSEEISQLFGGWQETLIWSCLQGVMGRLYAASEESPASAMAILGDFCFFAGEPDRELALCQPAWRQQDFMIMVPQNPGWGSLIESCYKEKAKKVVRYAFRKEPSDLREEALEKAAATLEGGYAMKMIEEELFMRCREIPWCRDWVSQYADYGQYQKHGLGVAVLRGEEIVSGASSYSGYLGGIEVEIDTKEEFRRKGLAYACAAKLILECRKRGLYASWDAQNKYSKALAEKLGYHFESEYVAYEVWQRAL